MTKRKQYPVKVEDDGTATDVQQQQQPSQRQQIPLLTVMSTITKKKPKTMKIETEVEERVFLPISITSKQSTDGNNNNNNNHNNDDDDHDNYNHDPTTSTSNNIVVVKKKKKLRRVNFDAEDDDDNMILPLVVVAKTNRTNNDTMTTTSTNSNSGDGNTSKTTTTTTHQSIPSMAILEDVRPTSLRLTDRGGYLHTKQSRMKISQANQGKCPWNKGKERTMSAKEKISAGVRARNMIILQQKLQLLNITEEEWYSKKRQIKLLRERVRKAKVAAKQYELEHQQQQQQQQEEIQELQQQQIHTLPFNDDSNTVTAAKTFNFESNINNNNNLPNVDTTIQEEEQDEVKQYIVDDNVLQQQQTVDGLHQCHDKHDIPLFRRDIDWTTDPSSLVVDNYSTMCPQNGPGGLICCQYCMVQYTKYMTNTVQVLQQQVTKRIGNEVEELYHDMISTKEQLIQTIQATRRKPIPIRQKSL